MSNAIIFTIPVDLIKKEIANNKDLLNQKILEEKNRVCYIEKKNFPKKEGEETKKSNEINRNDIN